MNVQSIPARQQPRSEEQGSSCSQQDSGSCAQNVSPWEQNLSLLAGSGLAWYGWRRGEFLALLAGAGLLYRGWTGHCATYQFLGIDTRDENEQRSGGRKQRGRRVIHALHINRHRDDLYAFWRELQNLPLIMRHLKSVEPIDPRRSRWIAKAPGGIRLNWEAEIVKDAPGEYLEWRSLPGSQVDTTGSISFNIPSSGAGTDVVVNLKYNPPGGKLAARVAHWAGQGLEGQLQEDLRNFKQLMEAGEIPTNAIRREDRPHWVS